MLHFSTYFDKNYLARGLVLYQSLKEHCNKFELFVLCLDQETTDYFTQNKDNYPEIILIASKNLEDTFSDLKSCRTNRSRIEYYFTLSPCLPLYILQKHEIPHICSLDADILFLDDPAPLFQYLEAYSIIITPHKFSENCLSLKKYGLFNVSFQIFKNDNMGIQCLKEWMKECIDWCGDYFDEANGRFADQKYLDKWPERYGKSLKSLDDNRSGLAPWNLNNFRLSRKDQFFYSNSEKLIFFHFHNFRILRKRWALNGFGQYGVKRQKTLDALYLFYWNKLRRFQRLIQAEQEKKLRGAATKSFPKIILNAGTAYFRWSNRRIMYLSFYWLPSGIRNRFF